MRQLVLMFALVGCGESKEEKTAKAKAMADAKAMEWVSDPNNPQNALIERAIRSELNGASWKLTKSDLEKITKLDFTYRKITDAGLKELIKLKQLRQVRWSHTKISDEGFKELVKCKYLQMLFLHNSEITDAGLKEVASSRSSLNLT